MGTPTIDSGTVALGVFIVGNIGSLIWGAATVRAQLMSMQKELERQGKVLEKLSDVDAKMMLIQERGVMQGRRLDELTTLVMSGLIGKPVAELINKTTGVD